jgi:hypothetical protein
MASPPAAGVLARLEVALDRLADEVGDVGGFGGRGFGIVGHQMLYESTPNHHSA